LLMRLTLGGLYQARWSAHVHEEWIKAVLRDHPDLPAAHLHELRAAMDERAGDSLVTGYGTLIESLHCLTGTTVTCSRQRSSRALMSS
jgi:hypothetical protein